MALSSPHPALSCHRSSAVSSSRSGLFPDTPPLLLLLLLFSFSFLSSLLFLVFKHFIPILSSIRDGFIRNSSTFIFFAQAFSFHGTHPPSFCRAPLNGFALTSPFVARDTVLIWVSVRARSFLIFSFLYFSYIFFLSFFLFFSCWNVWIPLWWSSFRNQT